MVVRAFFLLALACVAFGYSQQNGDKQLNNVISRVLTRLVNNEYISRVGRFYSDDLARTFYYQPYPDECLRPETDDFVGTLSDVVNRKKIRFCLSRADEGDVEKGAPFGLADEDIPILGVTKGSYYGSSIQLGKLIANEASFHLGVPLNASFTFCAPHVDGWFYTIYNCLADDECDVTLPVVRKLPAFEKFVDFTCGVYTTSNTTVWSKIATPKLWTNFTGFVCSSPGTSQFVVAETLYPNAQFVFRDSIVDMWQAFCDGQCQYVVDYGHSIPAALSTCGQSGLFKIVVPRTYDSPTETLAAFTYRSSSVVVYDAANSMSICFSFVALVMAIAHLF